MQGSLIPSMPTAGLCHKYQIQRISKPCKLPKEFTTLVQLPNLKRHTWGRVSSQNKKRSNSSLFLGGLIFCFVVCQAQY